MLNPRQKAWAHQLRAVAHVADEEYRAELRKISKGAESLADERITNAHFDAIMRWFEMRICQGIASGLISPGAVLAKVSDPWTFTRKASADRPQTARKGEVKSKDKPATQAQLGKIAAMRKELGRYEPEVHEWSYLQRILHTAAKGPAPETAQCLNCVQASVLINALTDRMNWAEQREDRQKTVSEMFLTDALRSAEVTHEAPVPF